MTVYVVVDYVDLGYHIDSIWLDKERAETYCAAHSHKGFVILEEEISDMGIINTPNEPYLEKNEVVTTWLYNPDYGDDRECICGHPYHRHFDGNEAVGCKYCECDVFVELQRNKGES